MPWTRKLRELLQSGALGQVQHVMCDFSIQFNREKAKRLFDPYLCGGSLLDVGIYPTSITSMIFGGKPPQQVIAVGDLVDTGVDGHIATTLRYGPNQTAQLFCGSLVDGPSVLQVMGTKGRVTVHDAATGYWHCSTEMVVATGGYEKYETQQLKFPTLKYSGYRLSPTTTATATATRPRSLRSGQPCVSKYQLLTLALLVMCCAASLGCVGSSTTRTVRCWRTRRRRCSAACTTSGWRAST